MGQPANGQELETWLWRDIKTGEGMRSINYTQPHKLTSYVLKNFLKGARIGLLSNESKYVDENQEIGPYQFRVLTAYNTLHL